jgi:hypothetical protein
LKVFFRFYKKRQSDSILGREQAYFSFTISLRRSTTFSENHATAKYEYPHVAGQRLRYTPQMRVQGEYIFVSNNLQAAFDKENCGLNSLTNFFDF